MKMVERIKKGTIKKNEGRQIGLVKRISMYRIFICACK